MRLLRDFRLIPLVLMAITCFGGIKIASLVLEGGYIFRSDGARGQTSWAEEMFNFPTGRSSSKFDRTAADVTGSLHKPKEEPPPKDKEKEQPGSKSAGEAVVESKLVAQAPGPSASERAVLERLQERRQELDSRARELEIRESLLKAHEQRIEAKVEELKGVETRISVATRQKDEADAARFKSIVTMYENMKPKDAAKIFDRLDMTVLIEVASLMKPQKMSDVLAQMQPESAERLTVELARRSGAEQPAPATELPKIEGRPTAKNAN